MAPPEPAALHLRFRDEASDEPCEPPDPADLAAFLRPPAGAGVDPRARWRADADADADAIGVIPGARPIDPEGPLIVFFQRPDFGIPTPGYDHSVPDLTSWSVRPTTFGWIASVPRARRGPGPARAAQVLAGCLALALPCRADASESEPAVQRSSEQAPQSRSTSGPEAAPEAVAAPDTDSTPPAAGAAALEPASSPAGITAPPAAKSSGSDAIADAAWEGVDGFEVVLELKGGKVLRGHVGAVQAETFTLIDAATGQVLVLPKSGVATLRAYIPPPLPAKNGVGLLVGGGILTSVGAPIFLTGVVFLAVSPSSVYLHLPLLLIGGGAIGGGAAMLARGARRRTAFTKALREQRLSPIVSRSRYGWNGGLQLRF